MGIARETSGIGRLILGVFNAAAFAGLSTVVLPLLLDQRGATKPEIVIFYVLFALAAMAASLLGGGWCRRHGRYRTGIALGATLGLAGTAFLAAPTPGWAIYPAACGIAVGSLIYPSFVALLDNGTRSEARVIDRKSVV